MRSFAKGVIAASSLLTASAATTLCAVEGTQTDTQHFKPYPRDPSAEAMTVDVAATTSPEGLRTYAFSSTMEQRENGPKQRTVVEKSGTPILRTGDLLFDGLFALTIDDLRLNAVSEIRDGAYNAGKPIAREVFQTGEKWPYVWTRDTSYAANLSLAIFDPERTKESILFKTSAFRKEVTPPSVVPEGALQIVQDTGSGGSWPISTDRVTWALAAASVLNNLDGTERQEFAHYAYDVLRGTVEADRAAAYDPITGLYNGEQSFLDWRTQTYAQWIVDNLSWLASSKALSTNVCHYVALDLASRLAREHGDSSAAKRYAAWAADLKKAINDQLWLPSEGLYASMTAPAPYSTPIHKYDMLGTALAVLTGVAPEDRAAEVMARYPHAMFGVPVYYPHQPDLPVYHNRGIWPFVTGYALRAAAQVRNVPVVDNAIDSLYRGAALSISNMENLEWLTGRPQFDDGPVVNSRRQTWSVAAYLNMVVENCFGYHVTPDGILISPFLTASARRHMGDTDTAKLSGLRYHGFPVAITLQLPPQSQDMGYYGLQQVTLNGKEVKGVIRQDALKAEGNEIVVTFGDLLDGDQRITMVGDDIDPLSHDAPAVYSPREPELLLSRNGDLVTLNLTDNANPVDSVRYVLYRNGQEVATLSKPGAWQDPQPVGSDARYYSAIAVYLDSGHYSQPSRPVRLDGRAAVWIPVTDPRVQSNVPVSKDAAGYDMPVIESWGAPQDTLVLKGLDVPAAGRYALYIVYNNHSYEINSGVTNAVKSARITQQGGKGELQGVIQMPNINDVDGKHPIRESTPWVIDLGKGVYDLSLGDFFNMSYLQSNALYTGNGGLAGPMNFSNIAGFKLVPLETRTK